MKTKIAFSKLFFVLIAVIIFISCESPLALGSRLDLDGPVISITSPMPRKTVPTQFDIEGTADDNTGISQLLIKAATNSGGFPRQWRYQKGLWDISDNDGASWSPFAQAEWVGTEKSAVWRVSVNMLINDQLRDGEYTFSVQAWNKGGFSDDNSFKAIILIVDTDPPKVDISTPYLYRGNNPPAFEIDPLKELHDFDDDDLVWQDPAYLGKFLTQEFSLRWQIEDANDVWSIDLRFYPYDSVIDNDPDTPLPDNYIYRYYKDLPSPLHGEHPQDYIKPNGSVTVPDLTSAAGVYDGGGAILFPITKKTTVKVVAACLDMAGNPNQEKTLGYFVYWPKANAPWIVFTEGMKPPEEYYGKLLEDIEQDVFMVYPGRSIKATAFHVQGVKEVRYSLYKCAYEYDATGEKLSDIISETIVENIIVPNQPYSAGMYSGIFPWEFHVPPRTGYYILKTQAYTSQGIGSGEYVMLFRVQDITFPDFPTPPNPIASEPLFKAINSNKITISGIVDDATNVESLCMVWINPESKNYAAMSQLAYFRDKDYPGWVKALSLPIGVPSMEGIDDAYDPDNLNKLWKLQLSDAGIDTETNRILFSYSQDIDLSVLNIGPGLQPLKSQVFLLRAQNPDGKCTIITYAPQGDTLAPTVSISSVVIQGVSPVTCYPNVNATIQQFAAGDTITINGTWWEDSLEYLPEATYFLPNFKITVNNQVLPNAALSFIKNTPTGGTWAITATVGSAILPIDKLKDTLVVSANVKDIGGNFAETTSSWLIQSDHLRLMRISSENEDATHTAGEKVTIFLEFSKPVKLLNGSAPVLLLNSTGTGAVARAVYKSGQANQSSCQYFEYTVAANQDTVNLSEGYLNVIDLENPGTLTAANYPFAWYKGDGDDREEVRITPTAGYNGNTKDPAGYYIRTLPVTTNIANSDYQYTLLAGKHIAIDTLPPHVTGIAANTLPGYYRTGDIYITVTFNKPVKINTAAPPSLILQVTNGTTGFPTDTGTGDVRVNGNDITFKYSIKPGDTTNGNAVVVTRHAGAITDLAGGLLASNGISSLGAGSRTLVGLVIEANNPVAPTVRVLTAANVSNVVSTNVNGTTVTGISAAAASKNLSNLYNDALWLAIQPTDTAAHKLDTLEYSINGGNTWVKAPNTGNTPFSISQTGSYVLTARQIDKAGNDSAQTQALNFTWDPGNLITRVSSTTPNGTYSQVAGRNQIDITVYFRKPLYVSGSPQITLNAQRSGSGINVTSYSSSADRYSVTFTYTVLLNDSIPGGGFLDVTGISGVTAWDGNATGNGVNVSGFIATANLPPASPRRLDTNKEFKIETGNLSTGTLSFIADASAGPGYNNESDANFHGIRSDDGSYWTTLQIPFNHDINKGSGDITITQSATNYRLPAVLTEAQYNKFKGNAAISATIDTYYSRGTNGYINGTGSDTSTKYILQYNYNPDSGASVAAFSGDIISSANPGLAAFMAAFRNAEAITISVNAQAVTVSGSTLRIRLSGGSAPQVPGAAYTVSCPAGMVSDNVGNVYTAANYPVTLGGVAKPFVRIRKTQDTISTPNGAGGMALPRLVAAQPMQSFARMDCRTPGSTITYTADVWQSVAPADNNNASSNNNWIDSTNTRPSPTPNNLSGYPDGAPPTEDTTKKTRRPGTPATNYSGQISLGSTSNYNGYRWWVRARAGVGTTYSAETEEVAYRTVIIYQVRREDNEIEEIPGRSKLASGDQIWIRGGDALGTSSIPGFPLTWEDNWDNLTGKRAGIRLMTRTSVYRTSAADSTPTLNNSIWKFVTWEINTTAYVNFLRCVDGASSANVAWQYGPRQWAFQTGGWTAYTENYRVFPGEHRWCDMGYNDGERGNVYFSGVLYERPNFTVNSPNPWTGVNTP